eukprot:CAMPEP_0201618824 /NCGR_PEP_ID=MMETSP0492-20130828/40038_1 /ASSEMBLY_ACC=CAM_ASM_000837 /TAXON_ID=420259 /ORGANISM="Thalassiosira gravida, Strain GMp14c1" /LENGTH=156 /DNA_ID=CAMNT_0048087533 /DNA_START=202 /DNA_END=668 /DNA_ORIENTATION=+
MDEYFNDCDVAYTSFFVEDEAVDGWVSLNDSDFALSAVLPGFAVSSVVVTGLVATDEGNFFARDFRRGVLKSGDIALSAAGALSTALPNAGPSLITLSAIETLPFAISPAALPTNPSFAFSLASAAEAASVSFGGVDDAGMPRNTSNRRSNSIFRA